MLSKVIKNMIEDKFGQPVRYPRDCDALSSHISKECKTGLSGSTLKRLFGFTKRKGNEQPRLYTLDIISDYLGHKGWEDLSKKLMIGETPSDYIELEELVPEKIKRGEIIRLGYENHIEVALMYLGKQQFEVIESTDKKLNPGFLLKFKKAVAHYPLPIAEILDGKLNTGPYVVGKVSGITYIRRYKGDRK